MRTSREEETDGTHFFFNKKRFPKKKCPVRRAQVWGVCFLVRRVPIFTFGRFRVTTGNRKECDGNGTSPVMLRMIDS
jgi:hypothetical protein